MQKILIIAGLLLVFTGVLLPWLQQMGFGHLPGDFVLKKGNMAFYFPITTCVLLSLLITVVLRLMGK